MAKHFATRGKHRNKNKFNHLRAGFITALLSGVLVLVVSDAIIAFQAKKSLEEIALTTNDIKTNILGRDFVSATLNQEKLLAESQYVHDLTSSLPWTISSMIPIVGSNFSALTDISAVSEIIATSVIPQGIELYKEAILHPPLSSDGSINFEALSGWSTLIQDIDSGVTESLSELKSTNKSFLIPQIAEAEDKLLHVLQPLQSPLQDATTLMPLLPGLLGNSQPRNYLLVFQNPAEMRPQGGLPGSIALVNFTEGKISLNARSTAETDVFGFYMDGVIPISPERNDLFPYSNMIMANTTTTPSFEEAALKTATFWEKAEKGLIDGVIFIDPLALSYVMSSTGPVTLSNGVILDSSNVVPYLLNEIYFYSDDGAVQDGLYAETVDQIFQRLSSGNFDTSSMLTALSQGFREKRISFWSDNAEEQKVLRTFRMGIEPPLISEEISEAALLFEDNQGSKMDYYLTQAVETETGYCPGNSSQLVRIKYTLKNNLPIDLAGNLPKSLWATSSTYVEQEGGIRMNTYLYLPPGATPLKMKIDGQKVDFSVTKDASNYVIKHNLQIAPQASKEVIVDFELPAGNLRKLDLKITPLINPTVINEQKLACSS